MDIAGKADTAPQSPQHMSPTLSVVTPAYNEAENLPVFYERLRQAMERLDVTWEWIVIDDHSRDNTFTVIRSLAKRDTRVRGIRFARNFGAHTALTCGLHKARGACVAALAADLQDPPETIPELVLHWRQGAQIVWAARSQREGESISTLGFSRFYYWLMRNLVGMREMPKTGADFFLLDRRVVDAFAGFREGNVSIFALLTWMGFRQVTIGYHKKPRLHGQSGWNLQKKLKLLVDSIASFSYAPVRWMSYLGFTVAVCGFVYAALVIVNAMRGNPVQGWSSLMVVGLLIGGIQMLMMGVLGEYLWRAFDAARQRPRYIVEAATEPDEKVFQDRRRWQHGRRREDHRGIPASVVQEPVAGIIETTAQSEREERCEGLGIPSSSSAVFADSRNKNGR
jgi:dolichol-phosphate mannosyltransferase